MAINQSNLRKILNKIHTGLKVGKLAYTSGSGSGATVKYISLAAWCYEKDGRKVYDQNHNPNGMPHTIKEFVKSKYLPCELTNVLGEHSDKAYIFKNYKEEFNEIFNTKGIWDREIEDVMSYRVKTEYEIDKSRFGIKNTASNKKISSTISLVPYKVSELPGIKKHNKSVYVTKSGSFQAGFAGHSKADFTNLLGDKDVRMVELVQEMKERGYDFSADTIRNKVEKAVIAYHTQNLNITPKKYGHTSVCAHSGIDEAAFD